MNIIIFWHFVITLATVLGLAFTALVALVRYWNTKDSVDLFMGCVLALAAALMSYGLFLL